MKIFSGVSDAKEKALDIDMIWYDKFKLQYSH